LAANTLMQQLTYPPRRRDALRSVYRAGVQARRQQFGLLGRRDLELVE
jgi:hypothetical protein